MEIITSGGPAHVVLDRPAGEPAFLIALTHGAGGTPHTRDVLAVRDVALARGAIAALVTQPYRVRGARAPGSAVRQDAAWTEIIAALIAEAGTADVPLVQGGRSNGARVACRTAKTVGAAGVIALAFPLRPPAHPDRSREDELRAAGTSVLVVSGERDPFGVPQPDATTSVVVLRGETHALSRNPAAVGGAVAAWLVAIGLLAALGQAAGAWYPVGRCGAIVAPFGSSSPVSSNITTPLQSSDQPCSGWHAIVCAASRSDADESGHLGMCGHMSVPPGFPQQSTA